jgi:hypothetical protein
VHVPRLRRCGLDRSATASPPVTEHVEEVARLQKFVTAHSNSGWVPILRAGRQEPRYRPLAHQGRRPSGASSTRSFDGC